MKKTNKILVIIILLLFVFCSMLTFYTLSKNKGNNSDNNGEKVIEYKSLSGEKVTDGLYLYDLNLEGKNYDVKAYGDTVYYWVDIDGNYEFYRMNVYNKRVEKIGTIEDRNHYCYFEDEYIDCSTIDKTIYYNYDFKIIYEGSNRTTIPYKDSIITVVGNTIYKNNIEYKKSPVDFTNLNMYHYDSFDNNLYIYFANIDGEGCIYNLRDNKCEDYTYSSIKKYSDGLYFLNKQKINVVDINSNEIKEYDSPIKEDYLTVSELNNNQLYYFNSDYFRIYDLETGKVKFFDYRINKSINKLFLTKNQVYLIASDEVYVIELDKITTNEMTVEEFEKVLDKKLSDRILKIKKEYNVDIKTGKDATLKLKVWKQSTKGETDYGTIIDALDDIEEVLKTFGNDFFKEFVHDDYTGVRLYIVSDIKSDFQIDGEAFRYYDKYAIILVSTSGPRTLYHELMHSMEDAVLTKNKKFCKKWNDYNPKGFKYKEKYNPDEPSYKWTANYGKGDVYFVDNYSQTDELEDKARIFENISMGTVDVIKNNPYLLKKAEYLVSEIKKNYPMLEESTIFDSLKQD